jgi:hypothetical protein
VTKAARIGAIAAGIVLAIAGFGFGYKAASKPPSPMEPDDFGRITKRLASLAAETQLLAESVTGDKVTEHFARTHLDRLFDEVHDQETELDKPVPPALAGEEVRDLRVRLQSELTDMKRHLSEPGPMARSQEEAARLHDAFASATPPK